MQGRMKKVVKMIIAVVVCGTMLAACSQKKSCPAYGKLHKVPVEKQV